MARLLAERLDLPWINLDEVIERAAGQSIPEIFAAEGEDGFRQRELAALQAACAGEASVIALGGGALLNDQARALAESSGIVLTLRADVDILVQRTRQAGEQRPLLKGEGGVEARLRDLLERRRKHYSSFSYELDTSADDLPRLAEQAQRILGAFRVRGMGQDYNVRVENGGLERIGQHFHDRGLRGPVAVVSDRNVGSLYLERVERSLAEAGFTVRALCIEPGEAHKTIDTEQLVWNHFIQAGIERGSTVIALGGGVIGDLTGFAAATFLRGVAWVNLPTTLLAMVDSSLGGKTGVDLPQAKNLVGAFYPPRLVLADPAVLASLPDREMRSGMGEVIKHGVIGDPDLFALCAQGWGAVAADFDRLVRQGMAVKLQVIEADPFEKSLRQSLNLGHTIGHGVELASDFHLSHGEAVAVGMAVEARLAEAVGLAEPGLVDAITTALVGLRLPVEIPAGLSRERIVEAVQLDKKKAAGQVRFALPVRVGEVRVGVVVEGWQKLAGLV